jgi:hypothetical protein
MQALLLAAASKVEDAHGSIILSSKTFSAESGCGYTAAGGRYFELRKKRVGFLCCPLTVSESWHDVAVRKRAVAGPATQCRSNPVSGRGLLKTGIFQKLAGDYRRFHRRNG